MRVRAQKDFWSGVMFLVIAAIAILEARGYNLGTASKMGPGFFPVALGFVLGGLGVILMARSLVVRGDAVERMRLRPIAVLCAAVVMFGLMLPVLGLVISLSAVVLVSAFAGERPKLIETLALCAVLSAISALIFVAGLRLPLPLWPAV